MRESMRKRESMRERKYVRERESMMRERERMYVCCGIVYYMQDVRMVECVYALCNVLY